MTTKSNVFALAMMQASQLSLMPQLLLAPAKEIPTNPESLEPKGKTKVSKADKKKALADAAEYLKKVKAAEAANEAKPLALAELKAAPDSIELKEMEAAIALAVTEAKEQEKLQLETAAVKAESDAKKAKAAKLLAKSKAKRMSEALVKSQEKIDEILSQNSHLASIWTSIQLLEAEHPNHDFSRAFKIEIQLEDLWIALFDAATAEEGVILEHYQAFKDESLGITLDLLSNPPIPKEILEQPPTFLS